MSVNHSGKEVGFIFASENTQPGSAKRSGSFLSADERLAIEVQFLIDSYGVSDVYAAVAKIAVGNVVGSKPEPGNGVRAADTATLPHGELTDDEIREWFPDEDGPGSAGGGQLSEVL